LAWNPLPGTIVALRYQIIELLGVGGMARVYRAKHRSLNCEVALKIMAPQLDNWKDKDENCRRFEREARNAARLNHANCVRVLDYGSCADGSRYLAMDLVSGPTLREELKHDGRFSPSKAIWVAAELLRALAHAHRHDMLHRDVKPENIMFGDGDRGRKLMLIDFGLSRLYDDAPLTATGSCVGSPSYLAPERLLSADYDARADLYSVGVLLYEMLAGTRPFVANSVIEIAKMHITTEPAPIAKLCPGLPHELVALVHKSLAKKPNQRFANAEQMLVALDAAAVAVKRNQNTTAPFGVVRHLAHGSGEKRIATLAMPELPRALRRQMLRNPAQMPSAGSTLHALVAPMPQPSATRYRTGDREPTPAPRSAPAALAADVDETTCMRIATLKPPSRLRRAWAWLRFGAWRRAGLNGAPH